MPAAKAWKTKRELAKRMNAINLKRRKANLEASQEDKIQLTNQHVLITPQIMETKAT